MTDLSGAERLLLKRAGLHTQKGMAAVKAIVDSRERAIRGQVDHLVQSRVAEATEVHQGLAEEIEHDAYDAGFKEGLSDGVADGYNEASDDFEESLLGEHQHLGHIGPIWLCPYAPCTLRLEDRYTR